MGTYNIVILGDDGNAKGECVFQSNKTTIPIYDDDTISNVKKKILVNCVEAKDKSYEELYLFSETPIGIKIPDGVAVNPFEFTEFMDDSISIKDDASLLLNYITTRSSTIYVCFAESFKANQYVDKILSLYFPLLENIDSLEILRNNNEETHLGDSFEAETKYVSTFKDMGSQLDSKLKDPVEGIQHLDISYTPKTQMNISLDDVFHLVHATKNIPLIQLNVLEREKQYRLYAPNIATNGMQIPHIDKARINEFIKNFTDTSRVSFYMIDNENNKGICEFINVK